MSDSAPYNTFFVVLFVSRTGKVVSSSFNVRQAAVRVFERIPASTRPRLLKFDGTGVVDITPEKES